jgi:ribosomal peptide maturation radical SAM protein 1
VRDLDALPIPNFDDFYATLAESPSGTAIVPALMVETGRGCWWGAKSHCTFCGLNGGSMAFRSKSPDRVLDELARLRDTYDTELISVVDNILDLAYFRTVLPRVAEELPGLQLFYEVKANLSNEQVALLAAAGVRRIQPGLESLSDHVLKLMRKGTTMLQNVQLLKWCREHGVHPEWNLLFGFPGERPEDYREMLGVIDAIWALEPPSGEGAVRLDRFSPYHEDPEAFGMTAVRPLAPYTWLYPFGDEARRRIAYYFDFDYADGRRPLDYASPVLDRIRAWRGDPARDGLWQVTGPDGGLTLVDRRRRDAPGSLTLTGWQADAYRACDRVRGLGGLVRDDALGAPDGAALQGFLDRCVDQGLALRSGDRYLALAVHTPARAWAAEPAAVAA